MHRRSMLLIMLESILGKPKVGIVRGGINPTAREHIFQLSFVVFILTFSVLHEVYRLSGSTRTNDSPIIALGAAAGVYLISYVYYLIQLMSYSSSRPRVLLVEDDADTQKIVARLLRSNWDVVAASTLEQALLRLRDGYSWVLLDLMLPDGDGTVILREIRDHGLNIRVAVLTAMMAGPTYEEIRALKPDAILHKPFGANDLMRIMGSQISGRKAH
jgi:CheY-like chemotaxis protein